MNEIKEFIDKFIEKDLNLNYASYDINTSEKVYNELHKIIDRFFLDIIHISYSRSIKSAIGDPEMEENALQTLSIIHKRTLFQIKHYQNPKMGELLERHCKGSWLDKEFRNDPDVVTNFIDSKNIWACYVSHSEDLGKPLSYSRIYYVANTEKGLKIIDYNRFVQGKWEHQTDTNVVDIIDPGTLISVEKYQAPEEETSLADYNAE